MQRSCLLIITVILVGYLFWMAKAFFLPLVCAGAIAYAIIVMVEGVRKLRWRGQALPRWLAALTTVMIFLAALNIVYKMVSSNITALLAAIPRYEELFALKIDRIAAALSLDLSKMQTFFEKIDLVKITQLLFAAVTDLAGNMGLILIYLIFFLMEYGFFHEKMLALFPVEGHRQNMMKLVDKAINRINLYAKVKLLTSLATGLCSYVVMVLVGLDFASFWAFIIFFLNFIPNIGSIIATIFPCILAFVQFDTYVPMVVLALSLSAIQFSIGSIIEPRVMGKSFNMSGLLVILSLVVWGYIWGIVGMVVSVPIMVMVSIILANFPRSRWLAILMSRDGQIEQ